METLIFILQFLSMLYLTTVGLTTYAVFLSLTLCWVKK